MNTKLQVALIGGPMYELLYKRLTDFSRETGINVQVAFKADHPTLNAHLASLKEVPYDLVSTHSKYAPSQKHFLAPLDSFFSTQELTDFVNGLLDLTQIDGQLYGIPRNIDVRLLHYRNDLISHPPKTWNELLQLAQKINRPPTCYGFVFPGQESGLFGTFFELAESAGARLFPENLIPEVRNDGGRWALKLLRDLYTKGLVPPQITDWHYDKVHQCFLSGGAAMVGDWPGYYSSYQDQKTSKVWDRFSVAPYPVGTTNKSLSYGGSHTFALTPQGAAKNEAVKLLKFLTAPDQQWIEAQNGSVPVRHSIMKKTQQNASKEDLNRWTTLETVIAHQLLIPPKFSSYPQVEEVLWHTVQQAMTAKIEIDEALEKITSQIAEIVKSQEQKPIVRTKFAMRL